MRKLMLVGAALGMSLSAGPVFANGPSGSTESGNEVSCRGTGAPAANVYAGLNGVEACSDDGLPLDGRIIVSLEGGYAAADGDASNPAELQGWARLDAGGVSCGGATNGDWDSTDGGGGSCQP